MNDINLFYDQKINRLISDLNETRQKRNIYLVAKIISFMTFLIAGYNSFNGLTYLVPILLLALYILFVYLDSIQETHEEETKALVHVYSTELAYMSNDFSSLDSGARYISTEHDYSFDLDIFGENSLFQEINRTVTVQGADMLAKFITDPVVSNSAVLDRQQSINELSESIEWTHDFRAAGKIHATSEFNGKVIERWKDLKHLFGKRTRGILYVLNMVTFTAAILAILDVISYLSLTVIVTLQLMIWIIASKSINKIHNELDKTINAIANYFHLIWRISRIEFKSKELVLLQNELFAETNALLAFKELKSLQNNLDQRGNVLGSILFNALYLRDIYTTVKLMAWRDKYVFHIQKWIDAVSMVDALISMANYKHNHPDYVLPEICPNFMISAKGIAHPLIKTDTVIGNDVTIEGLHKIFIVTGANMAGKSTFLRSVGINLVLALSGNVVRSNEFLFTPIKLFTSMRTSDSLSKGKSYFHAELLRLKKLHEKARNSGPVLVILDEMLKGTNSEDKVNGSLKFLIKLLGLEISGIVATHDLALGQLSTDYPDNFQNICFEVDHINDELVYSYKLQSGISKNMNATILMRKMELI